MTGHAIAALFAGLFVLASVASFIPVHAAIATVNVTIDNYAFSPSTITVVIGVNNTVQWTNDMAIEHTVTSNNSAFPKGVLSAGASYPVTFSSPGVYGYHCSIHTFMMGTVIVLSPATTSSTSSSTSSTSATTQGTTSVTSTSGGSSSSTTSAQSSSSSETTQTSSTSSSPTTSATSTSATSSSTSTSSTTATGTASSTTSQSSTSGSGSGVPEFPLQTGLAVATTVAVAAAYALARRTRTPARTGRLA